MSTQESKIENPFETQSTSNAYDTVDEVYRLSALGVKSFIDPLSFGKDANIVDLGAGTGISSEILSEGCRNFCLVEPSLAMLEHANKRLGEKVLYVQATAEDMYQAFNKDVDAVYALNCIHLFPDLAKAFAGVAASLKQGGSLIFNITAPSYSFENISQLEKDIYQANINFYKNLNKIAPNLILEKTVELLEENLEGKSDQMFTKESLISFLEGMNFKFSDMKVLEISTEISYQQNIWRMMANSFLQDQEKIETLVMGVEVPSKMLVKQAVFIFENLN
jgi:ubiquinone/menaquinone biosynthesis C-methylase UbiE